MKSQYDQNKYRYNGKELQDQEFADRSGLEEYDYGARMQDPQIGRWATLDTKAEKYFQIAPYAYGGDNPIKYFDIDGKEIVDPNNPFTEKVRQILAQTEGGQQLWAQMKASPRRIHFIDNRIHKTQSAQNLSEIIQGGRADAETFSKTEYENALKGIVVDGGAVTTFNQHTGLYDKTADWDDTYVVLNETSGAGIVSKIGILAAQQGADLPKDIQDLVILWLMGHEGKHTLQNSMEFYKKKYNKNTKKYVKNETKSAEIAPEDRSHEVEADAEGQELFFQRIKKYVVAPRGN